MSTERKVYTLSEYCKLLKESQEFKAKKGSDNIDSENKKNNGKAVKDIFKQGKEFDGGISEKPKKRENHRDTTDFNKTTLGVDFAYEPSKEYKDRVKAQVHGFPSAENEKNSKIKEENKGLDFEGNEDFYKERADVTKERSDARNVLKTSGLQSKEINKETPEIFKDNTIFNESKKMKRLHFSKTVFLNENEMLKKIPDDMKVDGNKFFMKDSVGNEYLIECKKDKVVTDYIHTNVIDYRNPTLLKEELEKMKHLAGYKSSNTQTRVDESEKVENDRVRKMIDETKKFIK